MTAPQPKTQSNWPQHCPDCDRLRPLNWQTGTCWCCTTIASEVAQAVAADEARWEQTAAFEQRLRAERGAA